MWFYVLSLFIVFATTHATWILETNVDYITPSETKDVQLVCKQDGNVENDKGIQTINGIRIIKLDPVGNKNVFAEIHVLTNQPSSTQKNVQVAGNLKRGNVAFLKATWPVADDKTEGAYGCEISGYDALDNSVIVNVRPSVQLKTKMLTESDVIDLIRKMTESHVKKQKELEQEIGVLRNFINENLQSIRRIIRDKDNEVTTELSNLKITMESTYSTKNEMKDQVSELKNITVNEILTDNTQNQKKLDNLSSLVQNTSSAFDKRFSEMTKSMSALKVRLMSSVNSLKENDKKVLSHLISTASNLTTKINFIDTKYERLRRKLTSDFTTKISDLEQKCPCTRPAPTTATPKPTLPKSIISNWPAGDYALVRPETGCPNLNVLKRAGRSLFKTLPYDSALDSASSSKSTAIQLLTLDINRSKPTELEYCVKDTSIPLVSSSPWPKGTYCIGMIGDTCPPDFKKGYVRFVIKNTLSDNLIGNYTMKDCCRHDRHHQIPIQLPTNVPFFLLRHRGTCQRVQGMSRTYRFLQIEAGAGTTVKTVLQSGNGVHFTGYADYTGYRNARSLCHYQPN